MQDRFKFRYVFTKDFGGKTGICYKMPIFNLDTITDENFNKIVKSYIDYGYKLISIEQSTGLKDKNSKLIYGGDIVKFKTELFGKPKQIIWDECHYILKDTFIILCNSEIKQFGLEVIGNIYENPEPLKDSE